MGTIIGAIKECVECTGFCVRVSSVTGVEYEVSM